MTKTYYEYVLWWGGNPCLGQEPTGFSMALLSTHGVDHHCEQSSNSLPRINLWSFQLMICISWLRQKWYHYLIQLFPTCQVRVVRFYVSCLLLSSSPLLLLLLNRDPRRTVFSVGPQPRPSTPSVPCRTSTTTIPAQWSLPDLNHDHPRPVFPAGPQPRVSTPSVPCRTSCRKIWDKECAEES